MARTGAGIDSPVARDRAAELQSSVLFLTRLPFARKSAGGAALRRRPGRSRSPASSSASSGLGLRTRTPRGRTGLAGGSAHPCRDHGDDGRLHEDGLADTADGFGGGETREQKLDIMRDSRTGAFGACALALSILLRVSALASLADPALVVPALIAAHGGARAMLPVFMFFVPPARRDGFLLCRPAAGRERGCRRDPGSSGHRALPRSQRRNRGAFALDRYRPDGAIESAEIDGQTGDALGAVEQVGEIVILLVALR